MLSLSDTIYRKEKAHMAIVKDVDQDTAVRTYINMHTCIAFHTAYIMRCNTIVFWLGRSSYEDSGNNNSGRHHRTNYWFDFYKAQ